MSAMQDVSLPLAYSTAASQTDLATLDQVYHAFTEILHPSVRVSQTGPLRGLRFAAKDMFSYNDRQPFCGLAQPPALGLEGTAPVLRTLLDSGACLTGFTRLTALAYEPSGLNSDGSRPVNPWGRHLITGGSSSGSAVAVAAGLVDFAIGSDTAGSLRIPAQACGVASYKPSYGLIPLDGAMPLAPSLDCVGFLARDVALLQNLAGIFVATGRVASPEFSMASNIDTLCMPDVVRQNTHLRIIMQKNGIDLSSLPVADLLKRADEPLFALLEGEAAQSFASLLQNNALPERLAQRLAKGRRHTRETLQAARDQAQVLNGIWEQLVPEKARVILPAMPCCTPTVEVCTPSSEKFSARALYALSEFTRLGSLLGLPVVTVPVGFDQGGAPLAVQIMGHHGQDHGVLSAAKTIQDLCAFKYDRIKKTGRIV